MNGGLPATTVFACLFLALATILLAATDRMEQIKRCKLTRDVRNYEEKVINHEPEPIFLTKNESMSNP